MCGVATVVTFATTARAVVAAAAAAAAVVFALTVGVVLIVAISGCRRFDAFNRRLILPSGKSL